MALGASGRNAGFIATLLEPTYHEQIEQLGAAAAREIRDLGLRNRAIIKQFLDDYGVWYEQNGSMIFAVSEEEQQEFVEEAEALQRDGYAVEFFDHDPTNHGFFGAMYEPDDMATQPYWLVTEIMAQQRRDRHPELRRLEVGTVHPRRDRTWAASHGTGRAGLPLHQRLLAGTASLLQGVWSRRNGRRCWRRHRSRDSWTCRSAPNGATSTFASCRTAAS